MGLTDICGLFISIQLKNNKGVINRENDHEGFCYTPLLFCTLHSDTIAQKFLKCGGGTPQDPGHLRALSSPARGTPEPSLWLFVKLLVLVLLLQLRPLRAPLPLCSPCAPPPALPPLLLLKGVANRKNLGTTAIDISSSVAYWSICGHLHS